MQQPLIGKEHESIAVPAGQMVERPEVLFAGNTDKQCLMLKHEGEKRYLQTGYYVGADWLQMGELAVRVQPKLNDTAYQIDHIAMLFGCLKHPEVAAFAGELYQLDLEAPFISVPGQDDLLTPMLVAHFLHLLREVVRQGLKKGYNPVVRELRGRVKGKIEVGRTLRQGVFRQRPLVTVCSYEEFSVDIPENRLLKQALGFAQRYVQGFRSFADNLSPIAEFCEPAFTAVGDEAASPHTVATPHNPLYRTYNEALRVGTLLLKRFGYSLTHTIPVQGTTVQVPPHWIDMAKLFELYVLGLLQDRFGSRAVLYEKEQAKGHFGLPDFLLPGKQPWIIDAKYKRWYQEERYAIDDIRQLSGYARDRKVLERLGLAANEAQNEAVVRCLIVYPDRLDMDNEVVTGEQVVKKIPRRKKLSKFEMQWFTRFYKLAVQLPRSMPYSQNSH